ncbi:P-loop containing nucleoside triphosphate hydrolase protein [Cantharellus anzutake]|uniref:P-loop containing nucleoside triphosphate hydrolase protein n=1 Tax=Cantharellus anzutake TaxID=1750568 RepID=UPI0019058F7A|nr:P-loop containing nucleoside triphosphate hydrolase protein [Cantharellus anzutake]KAF8332336.1 P-loop containing nucleoside triphosphate hydrolase protein [Cantharellus anzutake]
MGDSHMLDHLAPTYVPVWQRPPGPFSEQIIPFSPPPAIDFRLYASSIYPIPLLDYLDGLDNKHRALSAKDWNVSNVSSPSSSSRPSTELPPLLPHTYATRWIKLMSMEYTARLNALVSSTMYGVSLIPIPMPPNHPATLFSVSAPHLRENYPPISLNDTVWLRQLRPWEQSFQGIAFEARVHDLRRVGGMIIIRCDALSQPYMWESGVFNLHWVPQERQFKACREALECIHARICEENDTGIAHRVLFPNKDHPNGPPILATSIPHWIDIELNEEQKLAVRSIVTGGHGAPYLISGPPGTGKTKTIVETVFQILEHHPNEHILVCGASNSAADTLTDRLGQRLAPDVLFRLNDPSRPMDEVRVALHKWCHSENGYWALPPVRHLLSKRVIVTSCLDASLLFSARCSNAALGILEDHTQAHLQAPNVPPFPERLHFGYLLVDEAAQSSEAEICIPLSVVLPHITYSSLASAARPHITICGDWKQLGPRIEGEVCRNNDMDVSLLERLFDLNIYKDNPYSRERSARTPGSPQPTSTPFCNLVKNYRSHPAILMLPSTLFYNDTLQAFAPQSTQNTPLSKWPFLKTPDFPFVFIGVTSPEKWTDEHLSIYNPGEVGMVTQIITGLLGLDIPNNAFHLPAQHRLQLSAPDISVISPFREQVARIRQALRSIGLGAVDVGDVESLQGAENRVVIISTVRSSWQSLAEDHRLHRGIIHEAKRFNVALTRAKELSIIVGNGSILKVDPWWKQALCFAMRNNAYEGPPIEGIDSLSIDVFSRLEEKWRKSRGPNGHLSNGTQEDDEGTGLTVGSVVRETLIDKD